MIEAGPRRLLGFIPARSGSVRAPDKNIRPVAGMSPIRRAIIAAMAAESLDAVAFSTDSPEYLAEANAAGLASTYLRPSRLALDDTSIAECAAHYLAWHQTNGGSAFTHVVLLQPTSLFRTASTIDAAIACWLQSGRRSLVSVRPAAKRPNLIVWGEKTTDNKVCVAASPQTAAMAYVLTGELYVAPVEDIVGKRQWWDSRAALYVSEMPDPFDVDTEADLAAAAALLQRYSIGAK